MRLTLTIRSFCDQPAADPQVRMFDTFPIIIGRSKACDYCLDDASQYVSSNHALILQQGDRLLIKDTSSNGVYANGVAEPIGRGITVVLNDNDTLAIGDYTLSLAIEHSMASRHTDATSPDPYDPFKGDEPEWSSPSSHDERSGMDEWDIDESPVQNNPQGSASSNSDWPDWAESFDSSRQPAVSCESPPHIEHDPFSSSGDDFDWLPGNDSEKAPNPASAFSTDQSTDQSGRQRTPAAPQPSVKQSAHGTSQNNQPRISRPVPENRPAVAYNRINSSNRYSSESNRSTAGLSALLQAASLSDSDFSDLDDLEVLEQTGRLLVHMVDAMMVLLRSRAELKNFIRSDTTTLARTDNNPLKFSVNAADALTKLLVNDTKGYLQADDAIQEAVEDLKLHQLAMLEGMKLAVRSLILQFDPDKLARKLERTGGLGASIPITREAKLWELFCEQYDAIREEAVNDFGDLFGAEFRKAYEKSKRKKSRQPDF